MIKRLMEIIGVRQICRSRRVLKQTDWHHRCRCSDFRGHGGVFHYCVTCGGSWTRAI